MCRLLLLRAPVSVVGVVVVIVGVVGSPRGVVVSKVLDKAVQREDVACRVLPEGSRFGPHFVLLAGRGGRQTAEGTHTIDPLAELHSRQTLWALLLSCVVVGSGGARP